MAITGCILVFYDELDCLLNSDIRTVTVPTIKSNLLSTKHLPSSVLINKVEETYPHAYVFRIDLAEEPNESTRLVLADKKTKKSTIQSFNDLSIYVNPYTSKILGERQADIIRFDRRHIMNVIYELHLDLLLGEKMLWFLGLIAFLWLIDHFIILYLSFPNLKKWSSAFKIRFKSTNYKRLFDLHRASGVWFFPMTFVLATSSVYFNWYDTATWFVSKMAPMTPRYIFTLPKEKNASHLTNTHLSTAINIASKYANGKNADMATFIASKGVHEIRVFDERDIDPYGRRLIVVDANSGKIRSDKHVLEGGPGNVMTAWQYPLHSGKAFGWTGRILIFISGILVVLLCITGIKIWLRKMHSKKIVQSKKTTETNKQPNPNKSLQHA